MVHSDTMGHRADRARPLTLTRIIAGGKLAIIAWQKSSFAGRETNKKGTHLRTVRIWCGCPSYS